MWSVASASRPTWTTMHTPISASVMSEKYLAAVKAHVPVVRPEWVMARPCGQLEPEAPYLLQPLHGLTIVVTGQGFDPVVRERIKVMVSELGGTLAKGLSGECTHLIAESVNTEKFLACCDPIQQPELSKVRVVSCSWLDACLRTGTRVDDRPYLMARPEPCLSTCVVAIAPRSASDEQRARLQHAACSTGATRVERFSRNVTHILFGDLACNDSGRWMSEANSLAAAAPAAQLVTAKWLLCCEERGRAEPTEPFQWRRLASGARSEQAQAPHNHPLNAPPFHHAPPPTQPQSHAAAPHHHHHLHHHPHFSHHPSVGGPSLRPHVSTQQQPSQQPPQQPSQQQPSQQQPSQQQQHLRRQSSRDASRGQHMAAAAAASHPQDTDARHGEYSSGRGAPCSSSRTHHAQSAAVSADRGAASWLLPGWCVLQMLTEARPAGADLTAALEEAEANGGLRLLRDNAPSDLREWKHDGPAAVLTPHGPEGRSVGKEAVRAHHAASLRRAGIEPSEYHGSGGAPLPPYLVSMQWLIECVQARQALSPSRHPLFVPLHTPSPCAGFDGLQMCISQYDVRSSERRLAEEMIRLLGAKYKDSFSRARTHLVCPHVRGEKCQRAKELGIPMVTISWLKDCFEEGRLLPITDEPSRSRRRRSRAPPPPLPSTQPQMQPQPHAQGDEAHKTAGRRTPRAAATREAR